MQSDAGWKNQKEEEPDAAEIIMEGMLQHDGQEKKMLSMKVLDSWADGWFELCSTHFQFRAEEGGAITKRLALDKGYTCAAPDNETHELNVFRIVTEGKEFKCKASSEEEMKRWVDAIQAVISTSHPCLKEGFMTKQGSTVANWKRRYFLLFTDALVYLDRDEEENEELGITEHIELRDEFKGKIHFKQDDTHVSTETTTRAETTIIVKSGSRTLKCRAESAQETTSWVKSLREARAAFMKEAQKGSWDVFPEESKTEKKARESLNMQSGGIKRSSVLSMSMSNPLSRGSAAAMGSMSSMTKGIRGSLNPMARGSVADASRDGVGWSSVIEEADVIV
jgi:hypothetical protein